MILITGVDTYVGSHLFYSLADSGKALRICPSYNFKDDTDIVRFPKYVEEKINTSDRVEFIEPDFSNIADIQEALKGIDKVYHCAQLGNLNEQNEKKLKKCNVTATKNLVNICLESDVSKFCFLSSFLTFPNHHNKTIDENHYWAGNKNRTCYEISKYGAEMEVWRGISEGLNAFIVNPTFVLGSDFRQFPESGKILFKHHIQLKSKIGIVHINDVVQIMQKLMEISPSGEIYILNSENIRLETLRDSFKKKKKEKRVKNTTPEFFKTKKSNHTIRFNFRSKHLFDQTFSNHKVVERLGFLFQDLDSILSSMLKFTSEKTAYTPSSMK